MTRRRTFQDGDQGRDPAPSRYMQQGRPAQLPHSRASSSVSEEATPSQHRWGTGAIYGIVGVALVTALGLSIKSHTMNPMSQWKPVMHNRGTFTRSGLTDQLSPGQVPDSAGLFTARFVEDTLIGRTQGAYFTLRITDDPSHGGQQWDDTVKIAAGQAYLDPPPDERKPQINLAIAAAMEHIRSWQQHRVGLRRSPIIVDVTNGIQPQTLDDIKEQIHDMDLARTTSRGDTAQFCVGRITSDEQMARARCATVPPGKTWTTSATDSVNMLTSWLVSPPTSAEQKETSLYAGLWNFISATGGTNRRIVVVTDWIENAPSLTLSMYKDQKAVTDSSRWAATWSALNRVVSAPDLKGTTIVWVPLKVAPKDKMLMYAAAKFAEAMFLEHGAKFEKH